MGHKATISFGIVLAHHSVPLAIALENLWEAEDKAKKHRERVTFAISINTQNKWGKGFELLLAKSAKIMMS
jgi:CRISPR/Cas system-associated protein Cas10 (large subunit of type III CRISPR-Cas system)